MPDACTMTWIYLPEIVTKNLSAKKSCISSISQAF
jgi:hypothetical protein